MEYVRIQEHPALRNPLLIVAFEGWSDASEVASWSARYLIRHWGAVKFGEIDPEEFYVFTERRPDVKWVNKERRTIIWPANELYYHLAPDHDRDFIIFSGIEPHLKWRTYVQALLDIIDREQIAAVLSLGGVLAAVPHTQPARLTGTATDPEFLEHIGRFSLSTSKYEGPTGILGVLNAELESRRVPSASLWGSVPHYLSARPNLRVSLAMLRQLDRGMQLGLDFQRLERRAAQFDHQVNQAVAGNPEILTYVRKLEEEHGRAGVEAEAEPAPGEDLPSGDVIVAELEEFLRRRQSDDESDDRP